MSPTRVLRLDQLIEGAGATVEVRLGADGSVVDAFFAMEGLPRIEPLLLDRLVADVPGIVERICGICPAAHHLAGVRAIEALAGTPSLTPTADALRRLLHHGAVLQTHAQALAGIDAAHARDLSRFARRVVAAAGSDSHFPRCALPGGVLAPLPIVRRDELMAQVGPALESALELLRQVEARPRSETSPYTGHDVALVDRHGALDLYGGRLRAVAPDGSVTVDGATSDDWADLVAEARPGDPAPRPYLRGLGPRRGAYRVGPVAQLRAARHLNSPRAEEARQRWSLAGGDAGWARAVVALHAVEVVYEVLSRPDLVAGATLVPFNTNYSTMRRQVSGWVDGARGLLVHTYRTDGSGLLSSARITTPTAQNETWLAELLRLAVQSTSLNHAVPHLSADLQEALEAAIREADPCLPCTSSPPGHMQLRLQVLTGTEGPESNCSPDGEHGSSDELTCAAREGN